MGREGYRASYETRVSARYLSFQVSQRAQIWRAATLMVRDRFPHSNGAESPRDSSNRMSDRKMCPRGRRWSRRV